MELINLFNRTIDWCGTEGIRLIVGIVIFYIGWKLINKFVTKVISLCKRRNMDCTLCSFLESFADISLKGVLFILVLSYIGVNTASLAALVASAGLAIGLALQGSLANIAGGVIILLFRPFKVGDFIETKNYSGTVESIKIFYTHLITIDNKSVTIPNGTLANGSIINYSAKDKRRVDLIFSVSYDSDVKVVKRLLKDIINKNILAIKEPEAFVGINKHNSSSIDFIVKVWVKTEDYWTLYYNLLEEVKISFDENNITIPYPQIDVNISKSEVELKKEYA